MMLANPVQRAVYDLSLLVTENYRRFDGPLRGIERLFSIPRTRVRGPSGIFVTYGSRAATTDVVGLIVSH